MCTVKPLRMAFVQTDPVQRDLIQLFLGVYLFRSAKHDFLRADVFGRHQHGAERIVVGTISGSTFLPSFSARSTTAVINWRSYVSKSISEAREEPPGGSIFAVMTTTSVVDGSLSCSAFSNMNKLCGERIATSL